MIGTPSSRLRAENTTWYGWILCFPNFPCTEIESSRWSVTRFSTWQHDDRDGEADLKCTESRGRGDFSRGRARFIIRKATSGPSTNSPKWAHKKFGINVEHRAERERETQQDHRNERESVGEHSWAAVLRGSRRCKVQSRQRPFPPELAWGGWPQAPFIRFYTARARWCSDVNVEDSISKVSSRKTEWKHWFRTAVCQIVSPWCPILMLYSLSLHRFVVF